MALTNNNTAVECSFMAPGLGPWRPDMVPYVDERDDDGLIGLGLQWHPKMMFRTEISGVSMCTWMFLDVSYFVMMYALIAYELMVVRICVHSPIHSLVCVICPWQVPLNPYHTPLSWVKNSTELDYWLGGLITAGVAPQLSEFGGPVTTWDATANRWLTAYRTFGHMVEGGITTLWYDPACCHVQGECEWDVCHDTIASQLDGGLNGSPASGVYIGADISKDSPMEVPTRFTPDNVTLLVFASWGTTSVTLTAGHSSSQSMRVVTTSPTMACNVTLVGGFLSGLGIGDSIDATEINSDGSVARR